MKIKFEKANMLEKLVRAMGAVSQKNTHPFTEGVLMETTEDGLKMSTYDMEKSVRAMVEAEVILPGSCVINAQRLLSIVRVLPESVITLTVDESLLATIQSGRSSFSLHALPAKDFPQMPTIATKESFTMEQTMSMKMDITSVTYEQVTESTLTVIDGKDGLTYLDESKTTIWTGGNRVVLREAQAVVQGVFQ